MSQKTALRRYNIIINQLRKKPSTYIDFCNQLKQESEIDGYDYVISKRTLKRDIEDILYLYGIEIRFDFSRQVYAIRDTADNTANLKVLEAFDIINAFHVNADNEQYLHFDKRTPQGTQHLLPILDAIRKRKCIQILHQKFAADQPSSRLLEPLALKEFQYRWYLVANDTKDGKIKSFGLDRMIHVEMTNKKYTYPSNFDANTFFKYSFGIVSGRKNVKPAKIVLSFSINLKPYLMTLPLHDSQKLIRDTGTDFLIELELHPTQDLIREIASYGNQVQVIKPESFRNAVFHYVRTEPVILQP